MSNGDSCIKKKPLPNPWFSALLIIYWCVQSISIISPYHHEMEEFPTENLQDFAMYVCQVKPPSPLVRLNLGRVPISSFSPLGCSPKNVGIAFLATSKIELMDNLLNKLKMMSI